MHSCSFILGHCSEQHLRQRRQAHTIGKDVFYCTFLLGKSRRTYQLGKARRTPKNTTIHFMVIKLLVF